MITVKILLLDFFVFIEGLWRQLFCRHRWESYQDMRKGHVGTAKSYWWACQKCGRKVLMDKKEETNE